MQRPQPSQNGAQQRSSTPTKEQSSELHVCRQLTTAVVDQEAEYKVANKKLQVQVDHYKNALTGINEKLTVFNDYKQELAQYKENLAESEQAREQLQTSLAHLTSQTTKLVNDKQKQNQALQGEIASLKEQIETLKVHCADQVSTKQKLINLMIAAAAKKDTQHADEVRTLHEQFFEAKARMIDERVAETEAHNTALKSKNDEAEARALRYNQDIKAMQQKHSETLHKISQANSHQLNDLNLALKQRDRKYNDELQALQDRHTCELSTIQFTMQSEQNKCSELLSLRDRQYASDLAARDHAQQTMISELLQSHKTQLASVEQFYAQQIDEIQQANRAYVTQLEQSHNQIVARLQQTNQAAIETLEAQYRSVITKTQVQNESALSQLNDELRQRDQAYLGSVEKLQQKHRDDLRTLSLAHKDDLQQAQKDLAERDNRYTADLHQRELNNVAALEEAHRAHQQSQNDFKLQSDQSNLEQQQMVELFGKELMSQEQRHKDALVQAERQYATKLNKSLTEKAKAVQKCNAQVELNTAQTEEIRVKLQRRVDQLEQETRVYPEVLGQKEAELLTLRQECFTSGDVQKQILMAKQTVLQCNQAREQLQAELSAQKSSAYIGEFEQQLENSENVILELKALVRSTNDQNTELQYEIKTLKNYISELKAMIKMLLNPEGITALDKTQVGEIALTSMDQYLDQYATTATINGQQTRFFSGKVQVSRDINVNTATSPTRSIKNTSTAPAAKSPISTQGRKAESPAKSTAAGVTGQRRMQVAIKKSEQPQAGTTSYKSESNHSANNQ